MTDVQAEIVIEIYQRRRKDARNRELSRSMQGLVAAEQFFAALHALEGLNTREREIARRPEILQTLA